MGKTGENMGRQNEFNIVNEIHDKYYKDLSPLWKRIIKEMYGEVIDNEKIYCLKAEHFKKEDLIIIYKNTVKTVSVKIGVNLTMHEEHILKFKDTLSEVGVSDYGIETLLLYHYGDGTIDGSGNKRYNLDEIKELYKDRILKLNKEINKPKILKPLFNRFMKYGTNYQNSNVDYFYFGTYDDGIMIKMDTVIDILLKKPIYEYSSIYFGCFVYGPSGRNFSNNQNYEWHRNYCKLTVYHFEYIIANYISKNKDIPFSKTVRDLCEYDKKTNYDYKIR